MFLDTVIQESVPGTPFWEEPLEQYFSTTLSRKVGFTSIFLDNFAHNSVLKWERDARLIFKESVLVANNRQETPTVLKHCIAFHMVFGCARGATLSTLSAKKIPLSSALSMLQSVVCSLDCAVWAHHLAL